MTKKHFVDIAQALSESKPDMDDACDWHFKHTKAVWNLKMLDQEDVVSRAFEMRLLDWNRTCVEMGKALQRHNSRFEMQRFLFACGMDRENESQEVK